MVKARISKLLDRAEDPAETLDYGYQKQIELLQNVKKGVAEVVTSKKRLQLQEGSFRAQATKLDGQARQALAAGDEDLARAALARKQTLISQNSDQKRADMIALYVVAGLSALVLLGLAASVRILKQYERGVQFRLGRVKDGARGPGLIFIIPLVDRVRRVSLRIVTMPIQSQGIITKDNVSVDVSAVAYFRVEDAVRSVVTLSTRRSRRPTRGGGRRALIERPADPQVPVAQRQ